ncbi:hypothetical protein DPX16_14507 [Anabarilius grahami]|uniref:Uncharacterized protein n=1 Tax=Anabarilius grahami TaxID=495550 RepID=A0A3N0YXD6_ANAGA|nr:hypothetical protein DPX16_14507 [Anabarilius grahami]
MEGWGERKEKKFSQNALPSGPPPPGRTPLHRHKMPLGGQPCTHPSPNAWRWLLLVGIQQEGPVSAALALALMSANSDTSADPPNASYRSMLQQMAAINGCFSSIFAFVFFKELGSLGLFSLKGRLAGLKPEHFLLLSAESSDGSVGNMLSSVPMQQIHGQDSTRQDKEHVSSLKISDYMLPNP